MSSRSSRGAVARLDTLCLAKVISNPTLGLDAQGLARLELGLVVDILAGIVARGALTPQLVAVFAAAGHAELHEFLATLDVSAPLRYDVL